MIGNRERSSQTCSTWPVLAIGTLLVLGRVVAAEPGMAGGEVRSEANSDPAAVEFFEKHVRPNSGGAVSRLPRRG